MAKNYARYFLDIILFIHHQNTLQVDIIIP